MATEPTTLIRLLEKGFQNYSSGEIILATKRGGNWIETDMASFQQQIRDFAYGLHVLGVRPEDRVSIHSENSTEWLICDLAIQSLCAVSVPIYTTQPADQIRYILQNSGANVHIVSTDELFADTKSIMKSIKGVDSVISLQGTSHSSLKNYNAVLKMGQKERQKQPNLLSDLKKGIQPDTLVTVIYTSGTTGVPKGVMLTHNNIASNIQASLKRVPFSLEEIQGQNVLSYLPLSHIFERMISYMYLVMGAKIWYIEEIDDIREDFQHVRPYFFATVPRLLEKIQTGVKSRGQEFSGLKKRLYYWAVNRTSQYDPEHPPTGPGLVTHRLADRLVYSKIRDLFGGNLTGMISGGAPLSPDIFRFVNALGVYCGQGYGLTETSPVIAVQDPEHMRIGTNGLPLEGVEVRIAEDQEILVRGPNVMKGYFDDTEQTQQVISEDGWLATGDVGRIDDDGYLYVTDRKKDLFKLSTGKYVAPQNIETRLVDSSYIEQAIVTGYQKKYCTALIVPAYENAVRRLKRSGTPPEKPLREDSRVISLIQKEVDSVNRHLSPWETIKRFYLLEKPLSIENDELTPTLKVKRNVVNEKYAEQIESMYIDEQADS